MDRVFWSRLIAEFAKLRIIPVFSGKRSAVLHPPTLPQSRVRTLGLCHLWTSSSQFILSVLQELGAVWHSWYMEKSYPTAPVVPGLCSWQPRDESGTPVKGTPSASGEEEHPPSSRVLLL